MDHKQDDAKQEAGSKSTSDQGQDNAAGPNNKVEQNHNGGEVKEAEHGNSEGNMDQNEVVKLAQENNGHVTVKDLMDKLGWQRNRSEKALTDLTMDAIVWLDQPGSGRSTIYWFPGLYKC